jgi:hypothetical protein
MLAKTAPTELALGHGIVSLEPHTPVLKRPLRKVVCGAIGPLRNVGFLPTFNMLTPESDKFVRDCHGRCSSRVRIDAKK